MTNLKDLKIIPNMLSDHNRIKLKINHRKITGKSPNTPKSNSILLNNPQDKEEISGVIYCIHRNEWKWKQHTKICGRQLKLRWKFIALNAYIRNEKRYQINYQRPTSRHKKKKSKTNLIWGEKKEILIKIRAEINKMGNRNAVEKINKKLVLWRNL